MLSNRPEHCLFAFYPVTVSCIVLALQYCSLVTLAFAYLSHLSLSRKSTHSATMASQQGRRSIEIVYRRRSVQEIEEREAAAGLEQLGDGVVYTPIMALPAPGAPRYVPSPPRMHELPRHVTGIHYRHAAHEAMMETRYNHGIEYVLPSQVPARLEPEIKAASSLCKIKLGIEYVIRKLTGGSKEKKEKKKKQR